MEEIISSNDYYNGMSHLLKRLHYLLAGMASS